MDRGSTSKTKFQTLPESIPLCNTTLSVVDPGNPTAFEQAEESGRTKNECTQLPLSQDLLPRRHLESDLAAALLTEQRLTMSKLGIATASTAAADALQTATDTTLTLAAAGEMSPVHSSTPSVHFPATLPVPVHEHHHHHHAHQHHHHHHHRGFQQPNTPIHPLQNHNTNQILDNEISTPLPSYPSSAHISRTSSMRSLIISLETPSTSSSLFSDQHNHDNTHPTSYYGRQDGHASTNFGYRLGRRLDTLVSSKGMERDASGVECIHPLRRGVPMRLPLPTLVGSEAGVECERGRSPTVKVEPSSNLRNELDPTTEDRETNDREVKLPLAPLEDCTERLRRMVETQLHRTYEGLRKLADELEGCPPISSTPAEPEAPIEANSEIEKQYTEIIATGASTPAQGVTLTDLQKLVLERASTDPKDLKMLAELNMRLLRNLQEAIRKVDKLRVVLVEHNAGRTGDKAEDGEKDDGSEIYVVPEREEVSERRGHRRRNSSADSREREESSEKLLNEGEKEEEQQKGNRKGTVCLLSPVELICINYLLRNRADYSSHPCPRHK